MQKSKTFTKLFFFNLVYGDLFKERKTKKEQDKKKLIHALTKEEEFILDNKIIHKLKDQTK